MFPLTPVEVKDDGVKLNFILELDALKGLLKLEGTSEDARLQRIINAIQTSLTKSLNRPIQKVVQYHTFDVAPDGERPLYLKKTPVISVDAIEYRDGTTWTTLATDKYLVLRTWDNPEPPTSRTIIEPMDEWDFEVDSHRDPFRVKTTSGWDPVPDSIVEFAYRQAMDRYANPTMHSDVMLYRSGAELREAIEAYRLRDY